MILDEHFERIVILSMPGAEARAARAVAELRDKGLCSGAVVVRAVDGQVSVPPDWWGAGKGAWGCMQSHYRVVQDALLDGLETLLVLEDDCIWQRGAAEKAADFLAAVPDDWGQIYLGGQHRSERPPVWLGGVLRAASVHRTHAYGIHRRAMAGFLKHVLDVPDILEARTLGVRRHVDHQLEMAHQRGLWTVYCPPVWLAGQGAGQSSINGREQLEQWWHLNRDGDRVPVVLCERPPTAAEARHLHFGRHLVAGEPMIDEGVRAVGNAASLVRVMEFIAVEAWPHQRLPALPWTAERAAWLHAGWQGPVVNLGLADDGSDPCARVDLAELCERRPEVRDVCGDDEWEVLMVTHPGVGVPHLAALQASNPGARVHVVELGQVANGAWRNNDAPVRDWWRKNRGRITGRRVAWLDWDALVTTALPEVWPAGMLGKDLKDEGWHWWGERAALPELANHWCGVAPLGVTFWNAAALDGIAAEEYDEIYARDVFCELRTPSVCRKAGFPVESIALPGVRWYPVKAGTVPGIYHAVKG